MSKNAQPSRNPADTGSLTGAFRLILDKFLQGVDDTLPGIVVAYDRASNRAQVRPLIAMVTTEGEQVSRAAVASIPVLQIGGGGFMLNFPVQPGDLGWIKANDRDIANFMQSKSDARPNTKRKHSFSDALFIPDAALKTFTIAEEDAEAVVLQSLDGSVKVSVSSARVKIVAPIIEIVSPNTNITGEVTINGIAFSTHKHTGVQTGGGNTGGPTS